MWGTFSTGAALAFDELTDDEMDQVTAGTASVEAADDMIHFRLNSASESGRTLEAEGNLSFRNGDAPANLGQLVIQDSAQSNLSALVNINAVNSPVQVLLNLNVNIHSTVGTVRQINISGPLP